MTTNTNAALREKLIDLIAEHLSGTYHCTRVWEAWNVGTMSQDDFEDVGESDTPAELADAILAEISTAAQPPADGALNTIAALRAQLAEAQRDSERLDWMIEQCAYIVSDPDCCDGYWLNYARPDGTMWTQATEHETPRAAIDAAKGESNGTVRAERSGFDTLPDDYETGDY